MSSERMTHLQDSEGAEADTLEAMCGGHTWCSPLTARETRGLCSLDDVLEGSFRKEH